MNAPKLLLELRPIEPPAGASPGARVYALLPSLEKLLGAPSFGRRRPICLPGTRRPFDPASFFSGQRERQTLH
jgi:hypothetical protein